ncbi:MAG: UDP-2,3-diacylglucosamine diphosphatase LpxI [Paracoccaceae bacterium]|nr:UDP-2,3-diacylglucosamine diphosphatase LpxI [Paracoccaceae bacterium]
MPQGRTAIIAGNGALPAALIAAMPDAPLVAALEGFAPDGVAVDQVFRVERLALFLRFLEDAGVTRLIFAGAVHRPRLDPALFDPATAQMVPRLLAAMQAGDDATLREVVAIFEEAGFTVAGVADIAPDLVPGPGVLCGAPTQADQRDTVRAAAIVAALGAVDVGQGAVVAQGLCLAVEALPGTDAMLDFVAATARRPDPTGARGVLYKAPKPGQDRRIDLPALGPDTLRRAAAAGLAGIAWQAGGVILLGPAAMRAQAQALGLFLWAREP